MSSTQLLQPALGMQSTMRSSSARPIPHCLALLQPIGSSTKLSPRSRAHKTCDARRSAFFFLSIKNINSTVWIT
jgi:hypothetical protein